MLPVGTVLCKLMYVLNFTPIFDFRVSIFEFCVQIPDSQFEELQQTRQTDRGGSRFVLQAERGRGDDAIDTH